jgi:hypothetical protein
LFTYIGRNKANTADSTYAAGTVTHNDIKIDNAGNVLLGNLSELQVENMLEVLDIYVTIRSL